MTRNKADSAMAIFLPMELEKVSENQLIFLYVFILIWSPKVVPNYKGNNLTSYFESV